MPDRKYISSFYVTKVENIKPQTKWEKGGNNKKKRSERLCFVPESCAKHNAMHLEKTQGP